MIHRVDLLVIGSGAAGMCAAITAKLSGLNVVLIEKSEKIGGTTALSGGGTWIPLNHQAKALGVSDSLEQATTYLDHVIGDDAPKKLREAFLKHGPTMLKFLEEHTELKFSGRKYSPDYLPNQAGAAEGGRALDPLEFDGRCLGKNFENLKSPLPEFLVFDGMMVNKMDIDLLLRAKTSLDGFIHAFKMVTRFGLDRLRGYSRGTRLVLGNALAGRLYKSMLDLNIPIHTETTLKTLIQNDMGHVTGAICMKNNVKTEYFSEKGVVLATGGFPNNLAMRQQYLPTPTGLWSAGNPLNIGEGIQAAQTVGASVGSNKNNAFYSPISQRKRKDGSIANFPHLMLDRYKPGIIMINADGKRFVNESDSYHECGAAQYKNNAIPGWIICDQEALIKYGLGLVRPNPSKQELNAFIQDQYLICANYIEDLAIALQVDQHNLTATLNKFNEDANSGVDTVFNKGGNIYNRYLGDPNHVGNPCLAPLEKAPFYAVKILPGDIGTSAGLITDEYARVLAQNNVIPGLYAVGNDMNSIMGGHYPGPGITLGPGLTFGYIAARHAAGKLNM